MLALTTHLKWPPVRAVEAKDAVLAIQEHAGLQAILEAVEQYKVDLTSQLLFLPPSEQGAEYADLIGQIRGLEQLPLIVSGVIENGRKAELTLREQSD